MYRKTILLIFLSVIFISAKSQNIILGRPTDNSITLSILFGETSEFIVEYGTSAGIYQFNSVSFQANANIPEEIDLISLNANTRYFYRVKYKSPIASFYNFTPEYTFSTQKAKGNGFTFTIEADEHLYDKKGIPSIYNLCLKNQAKDNPDFMISLGDIFGDDHNPNTITASDLDELHKYYRPYLGSICHSIPFYVCLGNHEGENDFYKLKTPPNNLSINATLARKYYYPNPFPNNFYTGNTEVEPYGVGLPERNYYAWHWGDALFIVLDVYRDQCDTSAKPKNWEWSLGLPQYNWLKNTLENSQAKYKFVFAHHIRGQGRGGITNAKLFEWGGYEANGTSYTFASNRPNFAKPIHQLFIDNGVNIFFQGHDHVFAHEVLDGITYQAVPMPSDSTYQIGKLANADAYTSDTLDGTGHIRVSVSAQEVKVDYVRAYLPADTLNGLHKNGEVAFSYTVHAKNTNISESFKDVPSIYPNPAKDNLTIQCNSTLIEWNIFSLFGEKILTGKDKNINTEFLTNGVYILKIKLDNLAYFKKVIIQN